MGWRRAYRALLRLYPSDYTAMFAVEMQNAFEQAVAECRPKPRLVLVRFLLGEFVGLLIGAGGEWIAKLTTDTSVRGRCLPDLRMMRPPGVPREVWFAATCLNAGQSSLPDEVVEAQVRISRLVHRVVFAIANHDFPGARRYSNEECQARDELRRLLEKYNIDDCGISGCS